tara:strand:- start:327 stop:596 length:270 start_codon:yes stop_codon:yes gene_type:complete
MSTPNQLSDTPRTDAAWAKTFEDDEDQCRAGNAATDMRDWCATLERELATERARLDWLESDAGVDWQWSSAALTIRRAVIDAAMKEDAK